MHRWMYDRMSLAQLMHEAGLDEIRRYTAVTSGIDGWRGFLLDAEADGTPCRHNTPRSLYMEAPATTGYRRTLTTAGRADAASTADADAAVSPPPSGTASGGTASPAAAPPAARRPRRCMPRPGAEREVGAVRPRPGPRTDRVETQRIWKVAFVPLRAVRAQEHLAPARQRRPEGSRCRARPSAGSATAAGTAAATSENTRPRVSGSAASSGVGKRSPTTALTSSSSRRRTSACAAEQQQRPAAPC